MKREYDNRPPEAERKKRAEQQQRTNAIGMLAAWALAAEQKGSPIAHAVLVLLGECSRLADYGPKVAALELDVSILTASVNAYRRENARLRALEREGAQEG